MKLQKTLSLLMVLCLCVSSLPALAAPARDTQTVEVTQTDELKTLLMILSEAIPEECFGDTVQTVLEDGQAPNAAFAAQALWAACLLDRDTLRLTPAEADALYGELFTNGACDFAGRNDLAFLRETEDGYAVDPDVRPIGNTGVYLYAAAFDGTDVLVKCDVFACKDENKNLTLPDAEVLAEAWVTWRCGLTLSLRFAPETAYGFTLNSLTLSPLFRWGNFDLWDEFDQTDAEYSVCLPNGLTVTEETPENMVWQSEEGDASIAIHMEETDKSYDQAFAQYKLAHPGQRVVQDRLYDCFYAYSEGQFEMVVTADGHPRMYTVTLTFPAERADEFSLYAEIIRNSFGVWGLSNG